MKRHLYTLMFLLVAIALYIVGLVLPASFFLLLGVLAESVFWVRLLNPGRRKSEN
jgi:hypothetical protein